MGSDMGRKGWARYAAWTVPLILGLGMLSGYLSNSGYGNPWFEALKKPPFMPPGWVFGIAWTLLYILLGLALALALASPRSGERSRGLKLFAGQMVLNFLGSPIFFAGHDMRLALVVILTMLALAAGAGGQFWRVRPLAGTLMLPYLAWLCFAATLNTQMLRLNPGANVPLLGF